MRQGKVASVSWTGVQGGFQARGCREAQEFDSPSGAIFILSPHLRFNSHLFFLTKLLGSDTISIQSENSIILITKQIINQGYLLQSFFD